MSALSALNPRERVMVIGGGLILAALVLWRFAWAPMQEERAALEADLTRYVMLAQVADDVSVTARAGAEPRATIPLTQRVTRSAGEAGVPLSRLDPDGARLRVVVERARFDDLLAWIGTLEGREGAKAVALDVERLTEPGVVTARLTVEALQ
ncbi:hypothetical protein ATO6_10145 [Oceanicola sp. 22II-s10i]|uniref:type II secretion system protein GspM n=1 Tax=Oceanicola sp. 22II-s10i TaxID=1317116 RepID=UPI000B522BDF|nr:type II secretion system protein M [Oceanicola sp. 22II-s10i]OWU84702.1 hypothetical protein ATO6_10145 [Oceanicola sp. 22II-s10i]